MDGRSSPFASKPNMATVCIPLHPDFRFLHEPARRDAGANLLPGRTPDLDELAIRILFSNGGAFLVTGYRGVGKTSFINHVVRRLCEAEGWVRERLGAVRIITIPMSLPRRVEPVTLMHYLVRRLYERLRADGIYSRLDPDLRHDLAVAYERTFFTMSASATESLDLATAQELGIASPLKTIGIKLPLQAKRSSSRTRQNSYLGYDSPSAEYDLISLSERVIRGYDVRTAVSARVRSMRK